MFNRLAMKVTGYFKSNWVKFRFFHFNEMNIKNNRFILYKSRDTCLRSKLSRNFVLRYLKSVEKMKLISFKVNFQNYHFPLIDKSWKNHPVFL